MLAAYCRCMRPLNGATEADAPMDSENACAQSADHAPRPQNKTLHGAISLKKFVLQATRSSMQSKSEPKPATKSRTRAGNIEQVDRRNRKCERHPDMSAGSREAIRTGASQREACKQTRTMLEELKSKQQNASLILSLLLLLLVSMGPPSALAAPGSSAADQGEFSRLSRDVLLAASS